LRGLPRRNKSFLHGAQLWWLDVPVTLSTRSRSKKAIRRADSRLDEARANEGGQRRAGHSADWTNSTNYSDLNEHSTTSDDNCTEKDKANNGWMDGKEKKQVLTLRRLL
jgi:hypothetical protein